MKHYLDKNVYQASQERIKYLFDEFENVLVSFSGGKDSSVCLEMCYDYAKKNGLLNKLAMVHMDYEAQYQMTTDFVDSTFKRFEDIRRFWLCVPIKAQCSVNMTCPYWIPWEKSKKGLWVREMPTYDYVINEDNMEFSISDEDYEIPKDFFNWFIRKYGRTVSVIGIRTDESYNRQIMISAMNGAIKKYKGKGWIIDNVQNPHLFSAYPIYDWKTQDVWVYNAKFEKPYNHLYDLFYQAGLNIDQMRVASPFNDCATSTLHLYRAIDPNSWGKMVSRVNGVNFASIYGNTTAMGWRKITKPDGMTWKDYCYFLLGTLDEKTRNHYLEKLNTSIKFWRDKGGALDESIIEELDGRGEIGEPNSYSSKRTVRFKEYPDDLDVKDFKSVPSYKRMCVCIMKNDYYCKYMGFSSTKEESERRRRAYERYKNL